MLLAAAGDFFYARRFLFRCRRDPAVGANCEQALSVNRTCSEISGTSEKCDEARNRNVIVAAVKIEGKEGSDGRSVITEARRRAQETGGFRREGRPATHLTVGVR